MQKPLRILFLFEDLMYGGTQKQNLALALGLDRDLFSPAIATLSGPCDLDHETQKAGVPLYHLGTGRKTPPLFFLRLGRLLKQLNPDILVPCTALPNIWGRLWGKLLHIPLIVGTCRGGGAPVRQHEWLLWRLAGHIVCNSPALLDVMQQKGVPGNHLSYIANGVDCDKFSPASTRPEKPLILCVGRLAADKDHATLLRAFELVAAQNPDVRLRLVGEGPEEKHLRELAAELAPDAQRRIEFSGPSADPAPHYRQATIFALASIREGQPNVVLEAMSCGLAVCATAVGGIPALVTENSCGLLCAPGDHAALADNLLRLLSDPARAQAMGSRARQYIVNNFSFAAMIGAHQDLFLSLAGSTGSR